MAANSEQREHDVVVYGATGFVGKLTAEYLAQRAPSEARIALGGRSAEKLERTRAEIGGRAVDWPLVVADSSDEAAVAALAASTRAVATTVGPYAKYGMPLLAACASAGTHYADLTGEILFMRRAIDAHHETAKASGARIVHACGFDSIPSDLGVLSLHQHASAGGLGDLGDTTYVVMGVKGGPSGGTIDSLRGQIDEAKSDPAVRRIAADPYALSPDRSAEPDLGNERDPMKVLHEPEIGGYMAPFFMGPLNTRVVRRSNALQDYAYGRKFRYRELMRGGELPMGPIVAGAIVGGLAALYGGMSFGPTRKLLDRILPDPGEGPDEEAREKGYFKIAVHSFTSSGAHIVCDIKASGDPGYKATGVMLGESALCLALDGDKLPDAGGVLTPSTAMGAVLTERLRAAGHSYDVRAA
jgi:short subunit dehydrogenase-like uncharacterized protein